MFRPKPAQPTIQGGHPLAQSLMAAWPMSEYGGTRVANLRNSWGNGTLVGGATWRVGETGPEVLINATTRGISLPQFIDSITPPFSMIVSAVADTVPAIGEYRGLVALRGSTNAIVLTCGNTGTGVIAFVWNDVAAEYNAATGLAVSAGVPFVAAMSVGSALVSIYMQDRVSGTKRFTLSGTYTTRTLSGGSSGWYIGADGVNLPSRWWPGAISHVEFLQREITYSEFIFLANNADPFALYRPRIQRRAIGFLR